MNKLRILLLSITVILINGCTSTSGIAQFNPNNKHIIFKNGKSFYVPYNARYGIIDTERVLKNASSVVDNCVIGGLVWVSLSVPKQNPRDEKKFLKELAQRNLIGCSAPLSDREYNHYVNQEREAYRRSEREAERRSDGVDKLTNQMNNISRDMQKMNESGMPKTYDVNVHYY